MSQGKLTVERHVEAPLALVWAAYNGPDHVIKWNFASDDWHCPSAHADFREGGAFSSRMEAKDGSSGFDFEGTYLKILPEEQIIYQFGDRIAEVNFIPEAGKVLLRIRFDPDNTYPLEYQQAGWQAILDNFARYAESLAA